MILSSVDNLHKKFRLKNQRGNPWKRLVGHLQSLVILSIISVYAIISILPARALADSCPSGMSQLDCAAIFGNWANWIPDEGSECGTGSAAITSSGLPSGVISSLEKLKPTYEKVATTTGVPWQLLAAIHYRESNNNPNQDLQAGNPFGGPYTRSSSDYSNGKPQNLEQSIEIAAKHLIASSHTGVVKKPINVPAPDSEAVKDTLYSYNGRAAPYAQQAASLGFNSKTQPYEGSPYVMNNYDELHKNMRIITTDNGPVDGVDTRLGAFTIYSRLGGAVSVASSGSCGGDQVNGAVLGSIVKTAVAYAWPDHHNPNYLEMTPAYAAATKKAQANHEYVGGLSHPGIDCGGFVTRVMRNSGADPNYNSANGNTLAQYDYMNSHPELYKKLGPQTSTKNLQPGDIAIIRTEHTYIYVGNQPGFNGNAASASVSFSGHNWRSPMADTAYFSQGGQPFMWFRLIKQGG